jgi:hypothetical protein
MTLAENFPAGPLRSAIPVPVEYLPRERKGEESARQDGNVATPSPIVENRAAQQRRTSHNRARTDPQPTKRQPKHKYSKNYTEKRVKESNGIAT